ncbi:TBRG4, partial [Symbiodinium sp. CCMP2456]
VGLRDEALCEIVARRFSHHIEDTDALALTSAVYACGLVAYFDELFFQKVSDWLLRALALSGRRLEPQQ